MAVSPDGLVRKVSLGAIVMGVIFFGVGAAFQSILALAAIALSAGGAVAYTYFSLGRPAIISGLVTGLVGAVVAWVAMRAMMRWVAVSSGIPPVLSAGGTLSILGTSLLLSVLPAMGYVHFRTRFTPSFARSLVYGLILTLIGGLSFLFILLGEINSIARQPAIPATFLLGVPLLYAPTLEAAHRVLKSLPASLAGHV